MGFTLQDIRKGIIKLSEQIAESINLMRQRNSRLNP